MWVTALSLNYHTRRYFCRFLPLSSLFQPIIFNFRFDCLLLLRRGWFDSWSLILSFLIFIGQHHEEPYQLWFLVYCVYACMCVCMYGCVFRLKCFNPRWLNVFIKLFACIYCVDLIGCISPYTHTRTHTQTRTQLSPGSVFPIWWVGGAVIVPNKDSLSQGLGRHITYHWQCVNASFLLWCCHQ